MGAAIARNYLGENAGGVDLQLKPFVDTYGGAYTAAQLASETADAKRSGHWATNNDESGLWYVYNNQVARRPDGAPLQLTWKELAGLADSGRAPAARPGRLPPIDWAKVREQIERERRTQPTTSELWGLGGGGTR